RRRLLPRLAGGPRPPVGIRHLGDRPGAGRALLRHPEGPLPRLRAALRGLALRQQPGRQGGVRPAHRPLPRQHQPGGADRPHHRRGVSDRGRLPPSGALPPHRHARRAGRGGGRAGASAGRVRGWVTTPSTWAPTRGKGTMRYSRSMRLTVDDAGRILLPRALRERLHLAPGSELDAVVEGDRLIAMPVEPVVQLIEERGRLVATTSRPVPRMTQEELLSLIDADRDPSR